eukprot:TRINITY_DN3326_c0_g2_i2.p1 TRINITY_DN3326_c0_g2~~TRINITY_DN3326_c0_g2_i2.p1  ORF type:complete len:330 (-),score=48.89 TRINITY_DN3326_c0_g2_i2:584-1573(-)
MGTFSGELCEKNKSRFDPLIMKLSQIGKLTLLKKEFSELEPSKSTALSQEQIFEYLDRKCGGDELFDRDIGNQLLDRITKDPDGCVTVDQFITVFLEAEELLRGRLTNCDILADQYKASKSKAETKLRVFRQTELQNPNGLMNTSTLAITIHGARLKTNPEESQPYFIEITAGDFLTRTKQIEASSSPTWKETFNIDVTDQEMQVKITMISPETSAAYSTTLGLDELRDQLKHELILNLSDNVGTIHLTAHWIFSRVQYMTDVITRLEGLIQSNEEDKAEFERDLNALYRPFPSLRAATAVIANDDSISRDLYLEQTDDGEQYEGRGKP